jgi:two-component sensor histidine kinase
MAREILAEVATGKPRQIETVRLSKAGERIDVAIGMAAIFDADGTLAAYSVTMRDIRQRLLRVRQIALLNRELAHRVKNSLAIVQSLATQTLKSNPDPESFAVAFRGRLHALSAANDLLMQSVWTGSDLRLFIERQIGGLVTDVPRFVRMTGPEVHLPAHLLVPLGLALHELATNAIKYGALSSNEGHVALTWTLAQRSSEPPLLTLIWREVGGPPATPSTRRGFGSFLIERGIREAKVQRRFEPTGLVCEIAFVLKAEGNPSDALTTELVS